MKLPINHLTRLLSAHGWQPKERNEFSQHVSLFFNRLHPGRELTLPISEDASDYSDAALTLLSKLASIEKQPVEKLIREAEAARDNHLPLSTDDLVLRIIKPTDDGEAIPLTLARTALSEAETLIMASSCQAEKPAPFFRRIDNKISTSLLERSVFNHTRYGSFVLTVSCPILAEGEQFPLGLDTSNLPFTRKAFLSLNSSLSQLHSAISDNKYEQLADDVLHSDRPSLSANLTEAVGNIVASDSGGGIEFGFNWSGLIQPPESANAAERLLFLKEYAPQLYAIAAKLRPEEVPHTNRFIGTVEALRGDITEEGKRAGWVELSLLVPNLGWIRAAAELDVRHYKLADLAHINGAQFVAITGTVEPRPRVWIFTSISHFEHVDSP